MGLRPKQSESGQSRPQLRITKEGDVYLRTLLVQAAHCILSRRGLDTDLKRWGLKLASRGGKNAKKRAVVAVARKLAVFAASVVGVRGSIRAVAQQPGGGDFEEGSVSSVLWPIAEFR